MTVPLQDIFTAVLIAWIVALTVALVRSRLRLHKATVVMDYAKTYYVGKAGPAPAWVEEIMMAKLGMKGQVRFADKRSTEPRQAKDAESSPDGGGGGPSAAPPESEVGGSGTFADLCVDDDDDGMGDGGNNSGKDGG